MKIDGVNLINDSALRDAVVESGTTLPTANAQDNGRLFFLTQAQGQNPKGLYVYNASDVAWKFTNDNSDVATGDSLYIEDTNNDVYLFNPNSGENVYLDVTDTESTRYTGIEVHGDVSQSYVALNFDGVNKVRTTTEGADIFGTPTDYLSLRHTGSAGVLDKVGAGILHIRNQQAGESITLDTKNLSNVMTECLRVVGNTAEPYVLLKYNGDDKLRTTSAGMRLYGNTTSNYFDLVDGGVGGYLQHFGSGLMGFQNRVTGGDMVFQTTDNLDNLLTMIKIESTVDEPYVVLNYNGLPRYRNLVIGNRFYGDQITNYFDLTNDNSQGYLQHFGVGDLNIRNRVDGGSLSIGVQNPSGVFHDDMIRIQSDAAPYVALRYDSDEKMRTTTNGVSVTGDVIINGRNAIRDGSLGSPLDMRNTDLNLLGQNTYSQVVSSTSANSPVGLVQALLVHTMRPDAITSNRVQMAYNASNPGIFYRHGNYSDWYEVFNEARRNVNVEEIASTSTISRTAPITYCNRTQNTSFTTTVISSSYEHKDVLIFNKGNAAGDWTVSLDSNAIVYPDGSSDGNFIIPNGISTTVTLHKRIDGLWQFTVQG